jgi:hypothetical protein
MVHGGTNFGFTSGANGGGTFFSPTSQGEEENVKEQKSRCERLSLYMAHGGTNFGFTSGANGECTAHHKVKRDRAGRVRWGERVRVRASTWRTAASTLFLPRVPMVNVHHSSRISQGEKRQGEKGLRK